MDGRAPGDRERRRGADANRTVRDEMREAERDLLARTLTATGGNKSEAARALGIDRATLRTKLKKHGLV